MTGGGCGSPIDGGEIFATKPSALRKGYPTELSARRRIHREEPLVLVWDKKSLREWYRPLK
jgi:hypothetical protein